ncbi:hypothetical protein SAMN04515674_101531 [Pseudarcicella hirudinis]|uniref:Uncharacterized protein n=1 Tax=Pseudarcicella hirudinis TaxID=1079859 RepID=A0A1I5N094_9BACT|nr:hypothetical protein [Pseudarcicella hirudinis]SFP15087.1 hypothetical protein SAMN04515674_101531 [Pseudarcicella hirudinis]
MKILKTIFVLAIIGGISALIYKFRIELGIEDSTDQAATTPENLTANIQPELISDSQSLVNYTDRQLATAAIALAIKNQPVSTNTISFYDPNNVKEGWNYVPGEGLYYRQGKDLLFIHSTLQ